MTFGFHLCRGNQDSRWLVAGGYDEIARPVFGGVHAHRLLLEYDDERSGGFDPLRLVPDDRMVVLGLVTTKTPRAETEDGAGNPHPRRRRAGRPRAPGGGDAVRLLDVGRREPHLPRGRAPQARDDRADSGARMGLNANGIAYREALPLEPSGLDPVLCVHGFPESSYTWRHLLAL